MFARKREQESIVVVLASIRALFGVMCQGKQCVDSRLSVAFRNKRGKGNKEMDMVLDLVWFETSCYLIPKVPQGTSCCGAN